MERCIFLDKDGTLIRDTPYNVDITKVSFYEDIFDPLRQLVTLGYSLILISNQSGLARGYFDEDSLRAVFDHIRAHLLREGIPLKGYYYCPHLEHENCDCRKPNPGLLHRAAIEHSLHLPESWMVGDILADVGAGRAAGCKTILIDRSGSERLLPLRFQPAFTPDYIMDDFGGITHTLLHAKHKDHEHTRQTNTRWI